MPQERKEVCSGSQMVFKTGPSFLPSKLHAKSWLTILTMAQRGAFSCTPVFSQWSVRMCSNSEYGPRHPWLYPLRTGLQKEGYSDGSQLLSLDAKDFLLESHQGSQALPVNQAFSSSIVPHIQPLTPSLSPCSF